MKIARVFPTRTNLSPADPDAYFDIPDLFTPCYDEVHISVTFTWDLKNAEWLRQAWENKAPVVKVGGPAVNGEGDEFTPGRYLAAGCTITSRGCPNQCPFCMVDKPLKELPIHPGNNILDNNLLACSRGHIANVFDMLKTQHRIVLSGGLEADLITGQIVEYLKGINLQKLFLAWDLPDKLTDVVMAIKRLRSGGLKQWQIRCYILMGYLMNDTPEAAEQRCQLIYRLGAMPFPMLYRGPVGKFPESLDKWRKVQRYYIRPAFTKHLMKNNESIFNSVFREPGSS